MYFGPYDGTTWLLRDMTFIGGGNLALQILCNETLRVVSTYFTIQNIWF